MQRSATSRRGHGGGDVYAEYRRGILTDTTHRKPKYGVWMEYGSVLRTSCRLCILFFFPMYKEKTKYYLLSRPIRGKKKKKKQCAVQAAWD